MFEKIKKLAFNRMTLFFVLGLLMLDASIIAANVLNLPSFIQLALYKGFLLFSAAHAGYWIDRILFPYARPDKILYGQNIEDEIDLSSLTDSNGVIHGTVCGAVPDQSFDAAALRRAIIVSAALICVAFGA